SIDEVIAGLKRRHPKVEIVITGRYAAQELIDIADLVTEMHEVKHYYTQGVLSRNGIDK
ncbi:MAG: cob(I)yrinic acid a,c-diamide adenosyltransferase, partial [Bacteroides sp.]|nr:cob(I)yrinic acid a,c-diamide adenosyltransferase [Bacteroides sp.]